MPGPARRSPWRWTANGSRGRSPAPASDRRSAGSPTASRVTRLRDSNGRTCRIPQAATRARELWQAASAGGKAPTKIKLCTDASANHHRTAVALADLWRTALGVETEIVELEWNVYLDTRHNPGDCDLVRLGWSADFVDPEAFADVFESGNPQNTLGYRSAAYDGLLAKSRAETDSAKRMALLARAEQQLLSDVPVIPVFFRVSKRLVKPYVEGYKANPLGHVASRDLRLNSR